MRETNALSARHGQHMDSPSSLADGGRSSGSQPPSGQGKSKSSHFKMSSVLERLAFGRRSKKPPVEAPRAVSPVRQSVADLPPELVRRIAADLRGSRDATHLALATPRLQSALAPADPIERFEFLKQTAASAHDSESFMLELRNARTLPDALHAQLLEVHASRLPEIGVADGTFLKMQAGVRQAGDRFRLLVDEAAVLSAPFRGGPSVALAPHLKYLPAGERIAAMERLLDATRQHSSPRERRQLIAHFALGMNQFDYLMLPRIALRLLQEAQALPADERRELIRAFRTGIDCKMPAADKAAIEAMLVRFEDGQDVAGGQAHSNAV